MTKLTVAIDEARTWTHSVEVCFNPSTIELNVADGGVELFFIEGMPFVRIHQFNIGSQKYTKPLEIPLTVDYRSL